MFAILKRIMKVEEFPNSHPFLWAIVIIVVMMGALFGSVFILEYVLDKYVPDKTLEKWTEELTRTAEQQQQLFVYGLIAISILTMVILAGFMIYRVVRGILQPSRYEHSVGYDLQNYVVRAITLFPILTLIIFFGVLQKYVEQKSRDDEINELLGFALVIVIIFAVAAFPYIFGRMLPRRWAERPMMVGDYERTLRRVNFLGRYIFSFNTLVQQALTTEILFYQGKFSEAEAIYRQQIVNAPDKGSSPPKAEVEKLGWALVYQEKYEAARDVFLGLLELDPQWAGAYAGLSESYLLQDQNPEEAMWLAEKATSLKSSRGKPHFWATYAWALSRTRHHNEANEAAENTLRLMRSEQPNPQKTPSLFYLGTLCQEQGDIDTASTYFQQVVALDPQGYFGQKAGEMLTLSSSPH